MFAKATVIDNRTFAESSVSRGQEEHAVLSRGLRIDREKVVATDNFEREPIEVRDRRAWAAKMGATLLSENSITSLIVNTPLPAEAAALYHYALEENYSGNGRLLRMLSDSQINFEEIYKQEIITDYISGVYSSIKGGADRSEAAELFLDQITSGMITPVVLDSSDLASLYNAGKLRFSNDIYKPNFDDISGPLRPYLSGLSNAGRHEGRGTGGTHFWMSDDGSCYFTGGQHRAARVLLGAVGAEQILDGQARVRIENITDQIIEVVPGNGTSTTAIPVERVPPKLYLCALAMSPEINPDTYRTIFERSKPPPPGEGWSSHMHVNYHDTVRGPRI